MYIDRDMRVLSGQLDLGAFDLQFLVFGLSREKGVQMVSKRRLKPSLTAAVRQFTESFVRMWCT
jgi:hypothetical protein